MNDDLAAAEQAAYMPVPDPVLQLPGGNRGGLTMFGYQSGVKSPTTTASNLAYSARPKGRWEKYVEAQAHYAENYAQLLDGFAKLSGNQTMPSWVLSQAAEIERDVVHSLVGTYRQRIIAGGDLVFNLSSFMPISAGGSIGVKLLAPKAFGFFAKVKNVIPNYKKIGKLIDEELDLRICGIYIMNLLHIMVVWEII